MNLIIIIMLLAVVLLVLAKVYDINMRKLKQFVEYEEKKFNKLIEGYPSNIEICKYILNKLNNSTVKIVEDKEAKTSMYIALSDKIIIADVKNSYTRIQTIAHECLHSVQKRKMQVFNFIYSNIYLLYFIIVTILAILNKLQDSMLYIAIMILFSYIYYFVRSYLENDAMIKAKYLAKEFMEKVKISSDEEIDTIDRYGRRIPKHAHGTTNLKRQTSSTKMITDAVIELYDRIVDRNLLIRRINITANRLVDEGSVKKEEAYEQLDLFTDYEAQRKKKEEEAVALDREKRMQEAMLSIKKKFGKNAVLKGMNLQEGATARDRNEQIGGHKA